MSIEPVWNLNKVDISKMYFLVAVSIEPVWNLNTYQINNNSHHQNSEHRTSVEFKLVQKRHFLNQRVSEHRTSVEFLNHFIRREVFL